MHEFKVGDEVRLKSGSMPMTVVRVFETTVHVTYYDHVTGKLEDRGFPPECLIPFSPAGKAAKGS